MIVSSSPTDKEQVMAGPQAISVKQISEAARGSVAKVLEQHHAKFPKPDYLFGFYPPHWWLGIVIRNPDMTHVSLGDSQKLANDLAAGLGGASAALRGGKGGAVLSGGHLTLGFEPPEPVIFEG
jgi:hypothetical protein